MKKKILVAEDDEGVLDAMKTILELYGYDVVTRTSGREVEDLKDGLPDLLLLDIWMGKTDGRNICRKLKNQSYTKHLPIILVSATRDLAVSAKESGADDYLEKPFEMEDLIFKVKKYV